MVAGERQAAPEALIPPFADEARQLRSSRPARRLPVGAPDFRHADASMPARPKSPEWNTRHTERRSGPPYAPQYTELTDALECPSSSAIVCRAAASMRRRAPVSDRCGGPPAVGGFQPVSSS